MQQFLIYQSEDGSTRIDVMLEAETLWLNQKQLTELFGKAKGTVSEHIKHIFEDGELPPRQWLFACSQPLSMLKATVRFPRTVARLTARQLKVGAGGTARMGHLPISSELYLHPDITVYK